jgi:hypothetical protein
VPEILPRKQPLTPAPGYQLSTNDHQLKMLQQRRRSKILGFIIAEASAVGLLLIAGSFALFVRWSDSTLALSIDIATIVAAAAVAVIPIVFFAIAPVLPPDDRQA